VNAQTPIARALIRIAELEEENRQLRDLLVAGTREPPAKWGLTKREAELMKALASAHPCLLTTERALATVWPDTVPVTSILTVIMCHMRKKLNRHGVEIETVWGRGYRLSDAAAVAMKKHD